MQYRIVMVALACAALADGQSQSAPSPSPTVALVGDWRLNLARTHYDVGVDRRRRETFSCVGEAARVRCTIRSVRSNGEELVGRFSATVDGTVAAVAGVPEMDGVSLRRVNDSIVDATFSFKGTPTFAYRAFRSDGGRSLTIVSVDPVSRAALNSVVVYDRK